MIVRSRETKVPSVELIEEFRTGYRRGEDLMWTEEGSLSYEEEVLSRRPIPEPVKLRQV